MQLLKIKIYNQAYSDIKEAAEWYVQQSAGLGVRFKSPVIKQVDMLSSNAFHHAVRYDEVRCFKINKFPFNIHYTITGEEIHVFAVIHTSRNPEIWKIKKL